MTGQLQRRAIDELVHEGRYLYPSDVVHVLERFHAVEGRGVSRSVVDAYVTETLARLGQHAPFTPERFRRLLERRVTDLDVWIPDALYEVGPDRLSVYPVRWHERLTGVRDPVEYVVVVGEDLAAARGVAGDAASTPVPRTLLVDAMMVLGGLDRQAAGWLVREARLAGRIRVDPDQNPDADVRLPAPDVQPQQAASETRERPRRAMPSPQPSGAAPRPT